MSTLESVLDFFCDFFTSFFPFVSFCFKPILSAILITIQVKVFKIHKVEVQIVLKVTININKLRISYKASH